jgi:hypothetical protein
MADSSDKQLAILQLAKEMGLDPNNLTRGQYNMLAIRVRAPGELARDVTKAVLARASVSLRLRVVSEERARSNEGVCRRNECGRFRTLPAGDPNGEPACDACNCSSKFLQAKWRKKKAKCPLDLWDNSKEDPHETG